MPRFFVVGAVRILAIGVIAFSPLHSQIRWDEGAQAYWVTLHNEAGVAREMRVEPSNRVLPVLEVALPIDSGQKVVYRLRVGADSLSPQSLNLLRVPCPTASSLTVVQGAQWFSRHRWGGQMYCTISVGLAPGRARLLHFTSELFPGTGFEAIAVGGTEPPVWPAEYLDDDGSLHALVDSLEGSTPNGLVKRVYVAVPTYTRMAVTTTATGLPILAHELDVVCSQTNWIQPGPTCGQLAALIPTAPDSDPPVAVRDPTPVEGGTAALTASERNAIRRALADFVQALAAGRGTTVHENAYAVLSFLARTVRDGVIAQ